MRYTMQDFHRGLVERGHVMPTNVKGVWGRGTAFEDIARRFDALVMRETKDDGAQELQFPPVLPRTLIEQLGYLENFPQLAGAVHGVFDGATDMMLAPAACYPVYPNFSGLLPGGGRLITVMGWVFRHEPSDEPTRLQSFRMREFIRLGAGKEVVAWRDGWLQRGLDLLQRLGLDARSDVAADPFFGRTGKMMAAQQVEQRLKFEILVPVISAEQPTAVCSFNWHQDHFSAKFGIRTAEGATAQTACLGFGLERIALALLNTHGLDTKDWPADVRAQLWP
jgi:seryl-tRNA synthetase